MLCGIAVQNVAPQGDWDEFHKKSPQVTEAG